MLRVKNFIPALSVEGFEKQTDSRRGDGTYDAVIHAMELLKEKQLFFGISCCYTSQNVNTIGSDEFFDKMMEYGAKFGSVLYLHACGSQCHDILNGQCGAAKIYVPATS